MHATFAMLGTQMLEGSWLHIEVSDIT
ncbi:hypothetical protein LINPERPRIM_LOCUS19107 [Linum perenne]